MSLFAVCLSQVQELFHGHTSGWLEKEPNMNWIFETYSNVYSTAMMQDVKPFRHIAAANKPTSMRNRFAQLFGRR
jgi:hypothetical protein